MLGRLRSNPSLVFDFVLAVNRVGFCLRRIFLVRFVQQGLDAEKNLLDGDCRPPVFFFVQKRETNGAGGVDVGVEKWWVKLTFGRTRGKVVLKKHAQLVVSALPQSRFFAWNDAFPMHEIEGAVFVGLGFGDEAEWMVFPPGFSLLRQTTQSDARHVLLLIKVSLNNLRT